MIDLLVAEFTFIMHIMVNIIYNDVNHYSYYIAKFWCLAVKAITPLRPSFYYAEPIILKCDLFGYDRVPLENEVSPNFEKSGNVDINSKLNGRQAWKACNYLLFFEDKEEY